jgi:predicted RNA-binding Zn-ribbon protein involved in translation (DUF1610 family)
MIESTKAIEEGGLVAYASLDTTRISIKQEQEIYRCPTCGEYSVTMNGKCRTCQKCGWSSCDL